MNEKNPKLVELNDDQLEGVSGGVSMTRTFTPDPLLNVPTRLTTSSNVRREDESSAQDEIMRICSNRPRPRS